MNIFTLYIAVAILFGSYCKVKGVPCTVGETLGVADTTPAGSTAGTNTGTSYLLLGTNMIVPCCGVISKWNFGAVNTGDLTAQVWKQTAGNTYEVVGANTATGVAANTDLQMVIGASEQISVQPGYVLGWHSTGTDIVSYIPDGGANMGVSTSGGKTNVGSTNTWSTTLSNTERYLIQVELGPGTAPDFGTSLPQTVSAATSDSVGTILHTITPTDTNVGDIADLTVSINPASTMFELDGNDVKILSTLSPGSYEVVMEVVDACLLTGTSTLTINVVDDAPEITSLPVSAVTLREDTLVETSLHDLVVEDLDTDLADVTCRINSTTPTPAPVQLKMKPGTSSYAVYYVPSTTNKLDYDVIPLYSVYIICNDGTSDSTVKEFQISIEPNEPPVPTLPSPLTVPADTTGNNQLVGTITATDPESDDLTFTMNCTCPFQMYPNGEIYSTEDLNAHRTSLYRANVTVKDGYNTVGPTEMLIQITNLNTPPQITSPTEALPDVDTVTVDEHTDEGTPNALGDVVTVFTAAATDAEGDTLTWEMEFKNGQDAELFDFDPATGIITTKQDLDYETLLSNGLQDTVVRLRAFDGREYSDYREIRISVNDINETPEFTNTEYAVETLESAGTLECPYFDVIDEDKYDTQSYTIDCGGTNVFQVSSNTRNQCGAILQQTAEYDLDTPGAEKQVISCAVTVTDKGGLTATSTLLVTVHEEDDNPPDFDPTSYVFTIPETQTPGAIFGDVDATDDDFLAKHRRITYSTDDSDFGVDGDGGIFSKTDWTTRTVPTTKTFTVTARDEAGHTDTAEVTVNIVEVPTTTTTTTVATTLAENYQAMSSFLDSPENLAWLIPAILVGLAALGLSVFMCLRCCRPGACANMCKGGNICPRTGRGRIAGRSFKQIKQPVRNVKRTVVKEKEPVRVVREKEPVRVIREREPVRVVREPQEPVRVVDREAPKPVVKEEPKPKSSVFDCFKSKPKAKPPTQAEPWDFWNTTGF